MIYDIQYTRKDGSFGAYSGIDKEGERSSAEIFKYEINQCIKNGYEFKAKAYME